MLGKNARERKSFRYLPDVPQVVERPFIHKLPYRYRSNLRMLAFARQHRLWHIAQKREGAVAFVAELLQILPALLARIITRCV